MRILVWGINYAPEITGIAPHNVALCEFLHDHGHEVEMVTTFAYYPAWQKRSEDCYRLYRTDQINGVPVHRCWHFVPGRVSPWKRILHEGTFVLTSTLRVLFLEKPDAYFIASPPLLLGAAAWLAGLLKRAPFVFHVQDLQPDAAVGLGMLQTGWFTRVLYGLEAFAYKQAARVSGISEEILDAFRRKGVPPEKLILFRNGVAIPDASQIPARGSFRKKNGFGADDFLAVYAGNLGVKQGLNILLDAAEQLRRHPQIKILVCGEGAAREALAQSVRERNLANVTMLPLYFGQDYQELLVDADVSLITQQSGSGNAFFPSKLLVTLAYGSPLVTVADEGSALTRAVVEGNFGVNVPPGQAEQLAETFRALAQDRDQLRRWSENGRVYVQRFERGRLLTMFVQQLGSLGPAESSGQ